ncbi:hypothetical protein ACHQM5_012907 [Ranunculus cassubicifolius]
MEKGEEESSKKPQGIISLTPGSGGDRLKRDEWSEGAVSSLLDAYESKWVLRNRAKLKGHDWEDVARHVSSRANSSKSPKTQTQCKNKIESMKKRYRSESATSDASSWPLFQRLDLLLRYRTTTTNPLPLLPCPTPTATSNPTANTTLVILDQHSTPPQPPSPLQPLPPPPPPSVIHQNSYESNGVERVAKEETMGEKVGDEGSDKISMEMDSSTPMSDTVKAKTLQMKKNKKRKMGRKREDWDVGESIRWLGEVMVRTKQSRLETIKEVERMRIEAEAKRGEMDIKRTDIIANTQLQIAQLIAASSKGIDASLRIGRN